MNNSDEVTIEIHIPNKDLVSVLTTSERMGLRFFGVGEYGSEHYSVRGSRKNMCRFLDQYQNLFPVKHAAVKFPNTEYNVIDTMIAFKGMDAWKSWCKFLHEDGKSHQENLDNLMELFGWQQQVAYTVLTSLYFARASNYLWMPNE